MTTPDPVDPVRESAADEAQRRWDSVLGTAESLSEQVKDELIRLGTRNLVEHGYLLLPFAPLAAALTAAGYQLAGPGEVVVTRETLMSGIIVGIGGERDPVPPLAHVERAADLIMRSARRARATSPAEPTGGDQ